MQRFSFRSTPAPGGLLASSEPPGRTQRADEGGGGEAKGEQLPRNSACLGKAPSQEKRRNIAQRKEVKVAIVRELGAT